MNYKIVEQPKKIIINFDNFSNLDERSFEIIINGKSFYFTKHKIENILKYFDKLAFLNISDF